MKHRSLLLENPSARRSRGVGLTLATLGLVALLLLCSLPLHEHNHPDHIEASPFVIDAEAGLMDTLAARPELTPPPVSPEEMVEETVLDQDLAESLEGIPIETPIKTLESGVGWWQEHLASIDPEPIPQDAQPESLAASPSEIFQPVTDLAELAACEARAQALIQRRNAPIERIEGVIQPGQCASVLLDGYLGPALVYSLAQTCKDVYSLTRLKAGQPYVLLLQNNEFQGLEYEIDANERLIVSRQGQTFQAVTEPIEYQVGLRRVSGMVESSLFEAVTDTGESAELAMRLADIFGWEVDFIRDIRQGDSFKAVVEKRFREGEFAGYGRILAAEFVNQGHAFQGFLFEAEDKHRGYYDAQGHNLKRAFLKAPLSFTRISSGFTWKRKHPILGITRPHPAIDYAAPIGTPVMTVGDGRITKRGWSNGGGNTVTVRHGNGYETTYMHLSRYAKGLKKGDWVNQGQVIAYVGSTGLSTGPHLDFRMKHNGQFVNPGKINNPRAESLESKYMDAFQQLVADRQPLLDSFMAEGVDAKTAEEGEAGEERL